MTTPRCPFCNAQGLQHLKPHDAGLFFVVYCDQCGAIYGLVPKPQPAVQMPVAAPLPEPEPEPQQSQPPAAPPLGPEIEKTLTPHQAYLLQRHYLLHATPYLKIVDSEGEVFPGKEKK